MRRFLPSAIAVIALLSLAPRAHAVSVRPFPLTQGQVNANWRGFGGFDATPTEVGLQVQMKGTGSILADVSMPADADLLTISTNSHQPIHALFLWRTDRDAGQDLYQLPFTIQAGENVVTPVTFTDVPAWRGTVKKMGILLPAHATFLLRGIAFSHFSGVEKFILGLQSFWMPDAQRGYSINFVWGPHIASTPSEVQHLYDVFPPPSLSGTLVVAITALVGLALVWIIAWFVIREKVRRRRIILVGSACVLLTLWILLDVRMGSEFLSWVHTDHVQYIAAAPGKRVLRERDNFYDFAAYAVPFVADRQSYVFLAEQPWPYLGNIRYLTYPSLPGTDYQKDDTWVVYRRPDVTLSPAGELLYNGETVTPPGRMLGTFGDGSFIFRINLPPVPRDPSLPSTTPSRKNTR